MRFEKVNYSILGHFKNGKKYGIITRRPVSGYTAEGLEGVAIRKEEYFWYVDHIASGLAVVTVGSKTRDAAAKEYIEHYAERVKEAEKRMSDKIKENFENAPSEEEVAAWETVNYCGEYEHRTCKLMDVARRAGILYRNNGSSGDLYGATFYGAPEALKTIKKMIAEYEKRDAEKAAEEAAPAEPEAVAALPDPETVAPAAQAEPEAVEERPETISNSETAQEPEAARANEKKGENTMKKYAAYYEDFPSIPRIFSAQNKREAEKGARRYRRAWKLPALIRVDCLTDEEAARLESTVNEFFSAGMEAMDGLKEKVEASPLPVPAQAEPEAVAVLPDPEAQEERPETIPEEEAAPEAAEAEPEAQEEERAGGYKPARGPVKPKDFAAEALTGRGWCIVFDSGMNRTRVIVQDGIRETVAPMIEEAGFWWSENMKSYNRKLTHKAHRAAVALAERLREAVAG